MNTLIKKSSTFSAWFLSLSQTQHRIALLLTGLLLATLSIAAEPAAPRQIDAAAPAASQKTIPQVVITAKRMTPAQKRNYDRARSPELASATTNAPTVASTGGH